MPQLGGQLVRYAGVLPGPLAAEAHPGRSGRRHAGMRRPQAPHRLAQNYETWVLLVRSQFACGLDLRELPLALDSPILLEVILLLVGGVGASHGLEASQVVTRPLMLVGNVILTLQPC